MRNYPQVNHALITQYASAKWALVLDIGKNIDKETIKLELLLVGWIFVDKRKGVGLSRPVL